MRLTFAAQSAARKADFALRKLVDEIA